MKTLNKIFLSFVAVASIFLVSCTKNLEAINENPNKPVVVPTPYILTQLQRDLAYNYFDSWYNIRQAGVASQHWSQTNYTDEDRYNFRSGVTNTFFRNMYYYLNNANDIIKINLTSESMSSYGDSQMQIATAKVMIIWGVELIAEAFGDVPYSDAFQYYTSPTPKYDTQESIFLSMIEELKEAATIFEESENGWVGGDIIFKGDNEKWAKFANSLRLRLAVRLSNVDPALSAREAASAIADGVMSSNDDSAIFEFIGVGAPNEAPLFADMKSRNDFTITAQFTRLLQGVNDDRPTYTNPFFGVRDPRLEVFVGSVNTANGIFDGLPYGLTNGPNITMFTSTKAVLNPDGTPKLDPKTGLRVTKERVIVSMRQTPRPLVLSADFWSTFLDYANVCFLRAEVEKSAAQFQAGIEASLEQWGVDAAVATAYVNAIMAKYNSADAEKQFEMIITQKYIHNFGHNDHEAWTEYRRTLYPTALVKPGEITGTFTPRDDLGDPKLPLDANRQTYTFEPYITGMTGVATRLTYPISEFTANKANVEEAITRLGGNTVGTKLWWQKK